MPAVAEASSAHDHAVILFDGTCAFYEGAVKFIARRDPAGYFKYGASQSPTAAALLAPYGIDRETDRSIVLIETGRSICGRRPHYGLRVVCCFRGVSLARCWSSHAHCATRSTTSSRPYASGWPVHQMCARCPPARDSPAARVALSGGDPVGHGVLHRRRGARRGLCEGRRRSRIGCTPSRRETLPLSDPQRRGGRCATSDPPPGPRIDDSRGSLRAFRMATGMATARAKTSTPIGRNVVSGCYISCYIRSSVM